MAEREASQAEWHQHDLSIFLSLLPVMPEMSGQVGRGAEDAGGLLSLFETSCAVPARHVVCTVLVVASRRRWMLSERRFFAASEYE